MGTPLKNRGSEEKKGQASPDVSPRLAVSEFRGPAERIQEQGLSPSATTAGCTAFGVGNNDSSVG